MIELRRRNWLQRILYSPKLFRQHLAMGAGVLSFWNRFTFAATMTRHFIRGVRT